MPDLIDTEETCPICGAIILLDPATGKVTCDSYGCEFSGYMEYMVLEV